MNSKIAVVLLLFIVGCTAKNNVVELASPITSPGAEPFLFTDADGTVYLSWVETLESKSALKFSKLIDGKWSAPVFIDSGSTWFVNWADYPMVAANGRELISHYLDKSGDGSYAYDVKFTMSHDQGTTWSDAALLNDDGKEAEHGFVSLLPYGENFFVAWLDGRNTVMEGMEGMDHHEGHHGQMSLRAAVLDSSGKKINEWELDNRTCDCCQTSAALTSGGPVVIYRDRSDEEIRDMSIVRYVNGEWTKPVSIYDDKWKITGCPVNGPRVVAKDNLLAAAWFSVPEGGSTVNVIFSEDGGATFGNPVRIDEGKAIGRVDVELINESTAFVTWMEGTEIKGIRVGKDGTKGASMTIAATTEARSSGFPQMTRSGDQLIFAWTDDKAKTVKTATIKLDAI